MIPNENNELITHHQVAIIGAGVAGWSAAIYAARGLLDTMVFMGMEPGGQLYLTTEVENMPGLDELTGPEIVDKIEAQATKFGAKSIFAEVTEVDLDATPKKIILNNGKVYSADAVIIATGASAKKLGLPNEDQLVGRKLSYCATCDAPFFQGSKTTHVVGGGDTAMEDALQLAKFAEQVIILNRSKNFRASKIMLERVRKHPRITIIEEAQVLGLEAGEDGSLQSLQIAYGAGDAPERVERVETGGLFVAIGHSPNSKVFSSQLETDNNGYLMARGRGQHTNIPGVFVAGDVTDPRYRQAATAAGEGVKAALEAIDYIDKHELA